ncbi:unnamed protein product [Microthlaspi erraticum]|uniref:Terpene synthase metal-binding domain-containing protein n=1 Tax=Microthlaspi erraticum TaxID=1685480 RepID=A0A6D2I212_9BRAS|nr:unnamed protein product [Microthlaspi erraticum]
MEKNSSNSEANEGHMSSSSINLTSSMQSDSNLMDVNPSCLTVCIVQMREWYSAWSGDKTCIPVKDPEMPSCGLTSSLNPPPKNLPLCIQDASTCKVSYFPLTLVPTKPPKFLLRLKSITSPTCDDQESNRTFKKLLPSSWTDHFLSVSVNISEMDALRKEIDALKPEVKNKLMSSQGMESTKKRILMIYLLVTLGLEYHFEEEIYETLKEGLGKVDEIMDGEEDLYTVSTIFWFFRTYGHYISSDVFRRFKGIDGNFKELLKGDAKGILSLYEAAHLRTMTDYILDEALIFTSSQLKSFAEDGTCPPYLLLRIQNALTLSQRWNMEMVAAAEFISTYEQEKDHDQTLLKFAKLNFKLAQLHYLQELKILTEWYKEKDFASNLPPYFKDRLAENDFFILAVLFEPQVSRARIMYTKFYTILGFVDDTFDRYASPPEASSLQNSLERWAPDHTMDQQPDYLKFVLHFILDTYEEFERELKPQGKPYSVKANIEELKRVVKANFELAKWAHAAHVPSFEEYMEVGEVEVAVYAALAAICMCMGDMATKEAYEWLKLKPKLAKCISAKCRLMNDIYGYEDDMSRGYVPNAVSCYMKQYGVTKQEAIKKLHEMVVDVDKAINEELLTTMGVSRLLLKASMGMAKMIAICYNGYEGFTRPEGKTKEYINLMLVEQIRL